VPGDELKIIDPKTNKCYNGFIVKIEIDDEIHIELEKCETLLQDGQYTVEFVWKGTSFRRMLDGIYSFVNDENSVSSYLYYKIFGEAVQEKKTNYQNIPTNFQVKGLPELNYYQTLGISAAIVYHLANLKIGKVLVCAPSNIAADQLSEKISKTGLKVVRVCAKSRESISSRVEYLSLHNQIKSLNQRDHKRLFDLIRNKEETGELSKEDHELYKKLKIKAEKYIKL